MACGWLSAAFCSRPPNSYLRDEGGWDGGARGRPVAKKVWFLTFLNMTGRLRGVIWRRIFRRTGLVGQRIRFKYHESQAHSVTASKADAVYVVSFWHPGGLSGAGLVIAP